MSKLECCTFFGHRDFNKLEYKDYISEIIEYLIVNKNVCEFLSGGMGNFDIICEGVVRNLKEKYPNIKLNLIVPYLEYPVLKKFKKDLFLYDAFIIPNLNAENYKDAIPKRNEYMANNSRYIISGVYKNEGGAFNALSYAKNEKTSRIIDILKKKI